jgi:2-amino-4-hydroxy-6-hydroxymethyldihydropteridine diphosphokinase
LLVQLGWKLNAPDQRHDVLIGLGSNILPEKNLPQAIQRLRELDKTLFVSSVYLSHSDGSAGPDFLNAVVWFHATHTLGYLKTKVLQKIEKDIGRIRTIDKNAPRPIDLDILLFDGQVVDENIWSRVFIAFPLADLQPNLQNPQSGESIKSIASHLAKQYFIRKHHLNL